MKLHASIAVGLLSFVAIVGCSRRPSEPPDTGVKTEVHETATAKQNADTAEAKAKDAAMSMNAGCENLLKAYVVVPPDARDWAKRNPKTFPGGATLEAMLASLSEAGAQGIIVFTNLPPLYSPANNYDCVIILTLPSEAAARQKVFTSDARHREVCGLEPTKDYGQKYLGYSSMRFMKMEAARLGSASIQSIPSSNRSSTSVVILGSVKSHWCFSICRRMMMPVGSCGFLPFLMWAKLR